MEHREGIAEALALLGKVETARGDHACARVLYDESLALARDIGDQELIASGLTGLARVVAMQGEPAWAVRLWGSADALREALGAPSCHLLNEQTTTRPWWLYATLSARAPLSRHGHRGV
jgi:hypothetical protein